MDAAQLGGDGPAVPRVVLGGEELSFCGVGEPAPETLVYCCGPGPLLDAVEERCTAHTERFQAKAADPEAASDVFELVLQLPG